MFEWIIVHVSIQFWLMWSIQIIRVTTRRACTAPWITFSITARWRNMCEAYLDVCKWTCRCKCTQIQIFSIHIHRYPFHPYMREKSYMHVYVYLYMHIHIHILSFQIFVSTLRCIYIYLRISIIYIYVIIFCGVFVNESTIVGWVQFVRFGLLFRHMQQSTNIPWCVFCWEEWGLTTQIQ